MSDITSAYTQVGIEEKACQFQGNAPLSSLVQGEHFLEENSILAFHLTDRLVCVCLSVCACVLFLDVPLCHCVCA